MVKREIKIIYFQIHDSFKRYCFKQFISFLVKNNILELYFEALKEQFERNNTGDYWSHIHCLFRSKGIGSYISGAFEWASTNNGFSFWNKHSNNWYDIINGIYDINREIHDINKVKIY